jgi:hypothetical protein|tara:strand:+ start:226 stop:1080 length:855 start_codon:yes stop_codon:yes gene_type:complete
MITTFNKPKDSVKWQGNTIPMLGYQYDINKLKNDSACNTQVRYTTDYSKFKTMEDNRDVEDRHVAELVVNIRKRGQLQPILVNEKGEILDGQTRLKACKLLGIPVMYLLSYKTTIKDVILINTTQKSWGTPDYLKCFSHENHWNHLEYRKISKFQKEYPLKFDICIFLLTGRFRQSSSGKDLREFKTGNFKVDDLEKAQRQGARLLKIKAFAPTLVRVGKFVKAFFTIVNCEDFSYTTAYKQLEKNFSMFERATNQEDWNKTMVRVYNHGLKGKPRIFLLIKAE